MDEFDPATAASLDELAACLGHIHLRADKPTYRALEQQTIHANGFLPGTRLKRVRLTRSVLSDVLLGRKFPGKAFLLTFVDACGIDVENDRRWEQTWDRLAAQYQHASATPGEVEQLRQENEDLRQRLAAQKSAAGSTPTDTSVISSDKSLMQTDTSVMPSDKSLMQTDTSVMPSDKSLMQTDTSVMARRARELAHSSVTELAKKYPEGFDPKTGKWLEGHKQERDAPKRQYATGRSRSDAHRRWEELLQTMSAGGGGSPAMLGKVLTRVALAGEPVPRSAISRGSMLSRPEPLASGTVGKAVDALAAKGILTEQDIRRSGQPGPPVVPLWLSDKWATIGIHIDQQHDGPDRLAGIICGLDRKPLTGLLNSEVPRKGDQHDRHGLAERIRTLTESLLAELNGPREFLGVGVEITGHVYHGIVQDSVHAGWSQMVDLEMMLAEQLGDIPALGGAPAVTENDANALAIHGYYDRGFDGLDVALVAVSRQGIGGALILDGRLYRGVHGMAPEPGHLAVEYPQDNPVWTPPPVPSTAEGRTFDDECLCSTRDRKAYGHVDTLAVPARIEGHLAALTGGKISLERAAAAPRAVPHENTFVLTDEAVVLRRAGRALGRAITYMINTFNPGQFVVRLPEALAEPGPQTAGTEYLAAVEHEVDGAYSTGPADARRQGGRLAVQRYAEEEAFHEGAMAAATAVLNAFIDHARGDDGCAYDMLRLPPRLSAGVLGYGACQPGARDLAAGSRPRGVAVSSGAKTTVRIPAR